MKPHSRPAIRLLAFLLLPCLLLLFGTEVAAQESSGPDWEKLSPAELENELQSAVAALASLEEGNRAAAATALRAPGVPESEQGAWTAQVTARTEVLRELLRTLEERDRILSTAQIADLTDSARVRLALLDRAAETPPAPAPTEELLVSLRQALARHQEELETAERTLEFRKAQRQLVREELRLLPGRIQELASRLEEFTPARGDFLGTYERQTLELRRRLLRERREFAELAVQRWPEVIVLREIERSIAAKHVGLSLALVESVEIVLGQNLRSALTRAEQALKAARAGGPTASGAVGIFRLQSQVDVLRIRVKTIDDEQTQKLQTAGKGRAEAVNQQIKERLTRLEERFADAAGVSASTPELLTANLTYAEESRLVLDRTLLPDLRTELKAAVVARAKTQDQLVEAAAITHQEPAPLQKLLEAVPKDPAAQQAARAAFEEEQEARRVALQHRYDRLNTQVQVLLETDGVYSARRELIDDLQTFVTRHMYWVRSDDPLGPGTVTGVIKELTRVAHAWAGREVASSARTAYQKGRLSFFLTIGGFVLLVGAGFYLNRRLSRYHAMLAYRGGLILVTIQRLLATIFFSLLAPGALVLATLLLGLLGLPAFLADPLQTLLLGLAVIWFLRRVLLAIFRDDGVAVVNMHAPIGVAIQLRRASKRVAAGLLALALPFFVLKAVPVEPSLTVLPRLLYTVMLIWFGLVLISLLRRSGALAQELVGTEGARYSLWGFLSPLIGLGILAIVAMDILGYRFGARLLAENSIQTFLTALVLIGVYNLVTGLLEQAVKNFRDRRRAEVGAKAARAQAEQFSKQVVRFAGVAVIVVAVTLLFRYWGVGSGIRSFFEAMEITLVDEKTGVWLTGWDVVKAVLWIIGGHFLVAYLPGLLEVFLFSRLGKLQAGTHFIILSMTRYAVLFVAYCAAILSLRMDFKSLGWAFAAVSLGIGFGMQEIISNFVSGLILFIERPVRVGDVVTVGATTGTVEKIQIRATHILNWDRQVIVIPNRKFIAEEVTNWTHNDLVVRALVEVGVAYGTDVPRVREILFEIVAGMPKVLRDPTPRVWFWAFGDSSLTIRVFVFTELEFRVPTINELNLAIDQRFKEEGIEIAFPQRDLHLRSVQDPAMLSALGGASGRPLTPGPEPLVAVERPEEPGV